MPTPKPTTIPAVKARVRFGEIMKRAALQRERFIVEKSGLPVVAIINATEYLTWVQEREERFHILDRVKGHLPRVAPQEVERDVQRAVRAIKLRD